MLILLNLHTRSIGLKPKVSRYLTNIKIDLCDYSAQIIVLSHLDCATCN